jgi:hypothetical protein
LVWLSANKQAINLLVSQAERNRSSGVQSEAGSIDQV